MITGTYVISFCLLLHFPICLYGAAQCNFWLVKMFEWTDKGEEKRWKAKLHWRSLFRTSNRECFSQQSAGLQGDGVVISWQRGAGHVGTTQLTSKTPDLENADCTHTLSVSVWDRSLFFSVSLGTHFSYLPSPLLLAHIYSIVKLQVWGLDFGNLQTHFERNRKFWKWNLLWSHGNVLREKVRTTIKET